jgi:hypothetical protein
MCLSQLLSLATSYSFQDDRNVFPTFSIDAKLFTSKQSDEDKIVLKTLHPVWFYKEQSLHQCLGTRTTDANKSLKTDAKTVLYRIILRVLPKLISNEKQSGGTPDWLSMICTLDVM